MKKNVLTLLTFCLFTIVHAQPWSYNFGTLTASYNSTNAPNSNSNTAPYGPTIGSQTFMDGGLSNIVRIGSGSGSVNLENQTIAFGSGSYLRAVASSSTSLNMMKFFGMQNPSNNFYLSFTTRFGDATGGTAANAGNWSLMIGNTLGPQSAAYPGGVFVNANASSTADYAATIRWSFPASGTALTFQAGGSNGTTTTLTGAPMNLGTDYTIEVFANQGTATSSYVKSSNNYPLSANSFDIWVSNTKANAAPIAFNATNLASLDSWIFFGQSSTGNVANMFLDNLTYSNAFPAYPAVNTFTYNGSGSLDDVNNWSPTPTNFTSNDQHFIINSAGSITYSGTNWTVSGTNSKIVVGSGSSNTNLVVGASSTITGLIDVRNSATLTLQNPTLNHALGTLGVTSTVVYDGAGAQTIAARNYGHLTSSNVGARTLASNGFMSVYGTFTPGSNTYTTSNASMQFMGNATTVIPAAFYGSLNIYNPNATLGSGTLTCSGGSVVFGESITIPLSTTLSWTQTAGASNQFRVNAGKTLTVNGTINNSYTSSGIYPSTTSLAGINTFGTFSFASGSNYNATGNGATLPTATWNSNSNLNFTGFGASTTLNNRAQSFGNVTWNCTSQTAQVVLSNDGPYTINGLLNVISTGTTGILSTVNLATPSATINNFTQSGGVVNVLATTAVGDRTLNVTGNFNLQGGTFNLFTPTTGVQADTGYLNVGGNFNHTGGTINQNPGTGVGVGLITLNGLSAQTFFSGSPAVISGDVNLTINNNAGVTFTGTSSLDTVTVTNGNLTIGDGATIAGNLTLRSNGGMIIAPGKALLINSNGTVDLNNRPLRLQSDASGTARIGQIFGTLTTLTASNVTVERFFAGGSATGTPGVRGFRFIAHPFNSNPTLSTLIAGGLSVTGNGPGFTANPNPGATNNPSAFSYDPTVTNAGTGVVDPGWTAYTNANTGLWNKMQGIRVLFRGTGTQGLDGNLSYTVNPLTLNLTGSINQGPQTFALPATADVLNPKWSLVGNPYPSQIDIKTLLRNKYNTPTPAAGNIGATAYVFNPTKTGTTRGGYDMIDISTAGSYILPTYGVVLVQNTVATTHNIPFAETDKATGAPELNFRTTSANNALVLTMQDASGVELDNAYIRFNNKAANSFENRDGGKMLNEYSIYTVTPENRLLAIDSRPEPTQESIIPLGVQSVAGKSFVLKANELALPAGVEVSLKDKFLNTITPITSTNFEYAFSTTSNTASSGVSRFELVFKKGLPLVPTVSTFSVKLSPNPAKDMVTINFSNVEAANTTITFVNAEGKTVKTIQAGNVQTGVQRVNVKDLAKGIYYVNLSNGTDRKAEKLIIQ